MIDEENYYGFIHPIEGGENIYFRTKGEKFYLHQKVGYKVKKTPKGPQATIVVCEKK